MVAIIVVGGVAPSSAPPLPSNPVLTVAADGGLDVAVALAIEVDLVVGDLDSVDPAGLAEARERGVEVRRFAAAKNHTDLELAIDAALEVYAAVRQHKDKVPGLSVIYTDMADFFKRGRRKS